jgi:lysophospholipase L1-like esterase
VDLPWPIDVRRPHAIAVEGERVYLATGDNSAELAILDLTSGATLGTFDAEGAADGLSVRILAPGIVKLGRRQSDAPEIYRLDVTDPAAIVVLATSERDHNVRWKPESMPPVRFRDANGDGVFRLGCLGDSNTAAPDRPKWCERLRDQIHDARFEVLNVAIAGAVVMEVTGAHSRASEQLAAVLPLEPDAVVLAFGTNDRLAGGSPTEIRDAYATLVDVVEEAGLTAYVATTPPTRPCIDDGCPSIASANTVLQQSFGKRVIDFFDGVTRDDMLDHVHLNAAGQTLRAERVLAVIGNPLARYAQDALRERSGRRRSRP